MSRKSAARRKRQVSPEQKKQMTDRNMEYAVIPECQDLSYAEKEYTTSREEKMWDPNEGAEGWFPGYSLAARAVMTLKQEHDGIPNIKAIENSCSGVAEQYISDVLHASKYIPQEAMRMILMNDMPQRIMDKWTPEDMQLFTNGIMKHGKRFSIIRRKMLPHKPVGDFAAFYYVWKRSSMAEAWRKSRAIIKAKKRKMEEERLRKQSNNKPPSNRPNNKPPSNRPNNKPPTNLSNNILPYNLSSDRVMTRSATAAAKLALQNSEGTDDDSKSSTSASPSEKDEEASSTTESTDSSKEHVQKTENGLPESATTEKSPTKNEQISDNCPKQSRKRKLSIPRKIVNFEETSADEIEEIKCVPAPIIPQWKRQRRMKKTLFNDSRAFIGVICNS